MRTVASRSLWGCVLVNDLLCTVVVVVAAVDDALDKIRSREQPLRSTTAHTTDLKDAVAVAVAVVSEAAAAAWKPDLESQAH